MPPLSIFCINMLHVHHDKPLVSRVVQPLRNNAAYHQLFLTNAIVQQSAFLPYFFATKIYLFFQRLYQCPPLTNQGNA